MRDIGFVIRLDGSKLRGDAAEVKRVLGGLKGYGESLSVGGVGGGSGVGLIRGVSQVNRNLERMITLLRGVEGGFDRVGRASGRVNAGSKTGIVSPSVANFSAFSGFIRSGGSFTSQVGALASGVGRLGVAGALPLAAGAYAVRGLREGLDTLVEYGAKNAELAAILGKTRESTRELS